MLDLDVDCARRGSLSLSDVTRCGGSLSLSDVTRCGGSLSLSDVTRCGGSLYPADVVRRLRCEMRPASLISA